MGAVLVVALMGFPVAAQTGAVAPVPVATADVKTTERSVGDWLLRMHEASRQRTYMGTFVVQAGGHMSSADL